MIVDNFSKKLIWITGLSGAGKTTIAKGVFAIVKGAFANTIMIDGDSFREIIGDNLGHSCEDRVKNAYRIVKMCKYLSDQGIVVICSTMSLYKEIHEFIYEFFEDPLIVYLDVSMEKLRERNQKGLYLNPNNVIGIDLLYDEPMHEQYVLKLNNEKDLEVNIEKIIERCKRHDKNSIR